MLTITACPAGHHIRSSADRTNQSHCRQCKRETDRLNRLKQRAALDVVKVFEAAGVRFQNDGVPVAAEDVARQLVAIYGDEFN
jgi:hypothetical protein